MKKNTKKISKKQSSNKKSFWKRILIGIFLFPVIMAVLLFIALYIDYVNFKLDHEKCVAEDEELYRREGWRTYACPDYGSFSNYVSIRYFRGETLDAKPIIYLYPEKTTDITVELGYPENVTHTYPKYNQPWHVQAESNGNLTDLKTGRHYYALYWEGKNTVSTSSPKEGFILAGRDTIPFLEEKLNQLGLNEREAEEFIVYWLPKLENAKYNFIRFQTLDEQNKNMPLNITPKPQTLIRVMMEYDNLDKPIQIKEQVLLQKPQRNGFTVVEWGGTKIDVE